MWVAFAKYAILIQLFWLFVYGGADWIASCHDCRLKWYLEVELGIPLFPAASVIYLSLFPLLWLAPFALHSVEQLRRLAKSLAILIACSGIGFLTLPAQPAYPQSEVSGPFAPTFRFMDSINLNYNMFPSLHVGMAVVCAVCYSGVLPRKSSCWVWGWAAAIALSTLFTHEHHLFDMAAGGALGFVIARIPQRHSSESPAE